MHDSYFAQEPEAVSRARLAAIVESSDDVIVSKTLEGVITSWNPSAERTFGWTADEAIGRHITLIVPDDRRAEEDEVLARLRRGERIDHFETVRITKDGRRLDMSITVSPIRDADGHIVGASKVARDITERREDEVAARRLAAIVESSDDVIVSKTLDGIITSWNPAAERIFGWTAEEAIGRHITLIIPADRRAEEDGVLARIRRGERVDHFETVRIAKDGRLLDMSITVSPIRDSSGRVIGASKVARDIGERRRLEEQRAALLRQEQEARHEAEMLNRAKDELLATVSHELRTPLNAIFGWARLIQGGALDEATRIRAINAGRMRLDFERMDIDAVVEAALETVRPAATAKSVTLVSTLDPSIEPIDGAPDRLQQVVWNLLMNSVKFTPSGGRIEVSSQRTSDSLVLVVRDTGQGIEAGMLPHVFEAFRQADSSSTRAQGGLGLGLTLVRRLVELHGGTVTAESGGKDQGAAFTVSLPLPESTRTVKALASPSTPSLQGVRVLVVDDDAEFLDLSSMALRRAGADVRTASSAARAQELIEFWRPRVLLTDLAMPVEDGFMLVNTMRTSVSTERMDLAIIAMTSYGTSDTRARAVRAGVDLYLTKPIDPVGLAAAVAGVVHRPT